MSMQGDQIYFAQDMINVEKEFQFSNEEVQKSFIRFIKDFQIDNTYPYREQLIKNGAVGNYCLEINIMDIENFDQEMAL